MPNRLIGGAIASERVLVLPAIIGIAGRMCTGKTTLANRLAAQDSRYKVKHISDGVVTGAARALKRTPTHIRAHKSVYRGPLQGYANRMREAYGGAYFVRMMLDKVVAKGGGMIIVDDVRTVADVDTLRAAGASVHIIRLTAPIDVIRDRYYRLYGVYPTVDELNDVTELALEPHILAGAGVSLTFDHVIDTREPVEQVEAWARVMMQGRRFDYAPMDTVSEEPRGNSDLSLIYAQYAASLGGRDGE